MKLRTVILLILLVLLPASGYYAYSRAAQNEGTLPEQPATAVVRQGELLVSTSGSGELVAQEIPITFAVSGEIRELNAAVGDAVQAGEILASLDERQAALNLRAAQLNWETLTAPQVIVNAELDLLEYQQALVEAQEWSDFVREGLPTWYYQAQLEQAKAEYQEIEADLLSARARNDRRTVLQLEGQVDRAWAAVEKAQAELEWVRNYQPNPHDLALAEAQADLAAARLAAQEGLLDVLQGAPLPAADAAIDRNEALLALEKAQLAVDKAQWTLEQSFLAAPVAGTVTQVLAAPGERVNGEPVFTLRLLDPLQVRFFLDEADLAQVSPGDHLEIRLDTYPDQSFQGSVTRIDPALVSVEGSLFAQVWGEFSAAPEVALYPGMSLEVEVTAAEAGNALLLPVQALRQHPDGSYYYE